MSETVVEHRRGSGPDQGEAEQGGPGPGVPGRRQPGRRDWGQLALNALIAIAGVLILLSVATVPLTPREQAILAVVTAVTFLIANRFRSRGVSVFLVMLSLAVSTRYIFWRMTETLAFESVVELILGLLLVMAEIYAIIVLVLGYIQTLWPLERKPYPLPDDVALWPTVDIYVPTYNEPMSIVRATVLGCMAIDWPRDKLRVYLLDDGKREEFREFAAAVGCGYITRTNNNHAKAGNLNNAMTQTKGEFITIFDCDHIPTRAFLQMTVGWLVKEKRMAMVQTPHHFYSPDPFQRNLAAGTRVPAEGNLFYGLLQDGNDYWNACFFCGSCAVLRRTALEEIGGIAVETVTEDAHTMLKLHRRGWSSAYLRIPLAAGLATERLILHIGQRMRWARGMLQIFRVDNPLLGPGLTMGQRICYLQATGHFLFAIPRVIFLGSPLCYLLFNQNIIAASPLAIIAYALPHIFHSVATNSRLQGHWRHSFWSEIYETALALFLIRVTIATLASPRQGKFNVTAKGGLLENGYFDLGAVYPNLILAFFLIAGVVRGLVQLIFFKNESLTFQALLLNSIWALLSLLTVMAALAVGRETRQVRSRARLRAVVPVVIYLPDGRTVAGTTRDLSQGGGSIVADRPDGVPNGVMVQIEFTMGMEPLLVPARILRWEQRFMQVVFQPQTIAEEANIVHAVFGRADAWTDWAAFPTDKPLASLWRVLVSIRGLFRPPDRSPLPTRAGGQEPAKPAAPPVAAPAGRVRAGARAAAIAAAGLLLPGLLWPGQAVAQLPGAQGNLTVRPVPAPVAPVQTQAPPPPPGYAAPAPAYAPPASAYGPPASPYAPAPATRAAMPTLAAPGNQPTVPGARTAPGTYPPGTYPPGAIAAPGTYPAQGPYQAPGAAVAPSQAGFTPGAGTPGAPPAGSYPSAGYPAAAVPGTGAPGAGAAGAPGAAAPGFAPAGMLQPGGGGQSRRLVLSLRQLGAIGPLTLRGTSELQGVQFGVRADEVVTAAELNLSGAMSPALIPEFSNVTVTLNEQYVGTIPVNKDQPRFENLAMPVSPVFFQDNNRLNFRFAGRYTMECNDPLSGLLWSTLSDTSTLTLTLERLPPQRDLARLPLPFFDSHEKITLLLPFVTAATPSNETLQAAGIVSSWFGQLADYRGANFPVTTDAPPDGNAVVIATAQDRPAGIALPNLTGPTLAVVPNPNDPSSSLLVVAGRTGAEAVQAATALVLGNRALGGDIAAVSAPEVPKRQPYDAPYWIPTDRPVKFGELVDATDLQGVGYVPGTMRVPFRTAPDLYTWRGRAFPVDLRYRAPPGPIVDLAVSRLDVGINNLYLASFPLADDTSRRSWLGRLLDSGGPPSARVDVPVYDVFGQNDLQLFFDTRPLHRGDCVAVPNDLRMSVDPDSTIDFSRAYRWAELPNLAFFVNSGFPFTRMADLSETAVVLPDRPTTVEISAFLNMMGRIGALTGYPVIRVTVVRPGEVSSVADRDILLMGTLPRLGNAGELLKNSPLRLNGSRLEVQIGGGLQSVYRLFDDQAEQQKQRANAQLSANVSQDTAALVGTESPLHGGRSLVAVLAAAPQGLDTVVATLRDSEQAPLIQGDLSVLNGGRATSYRVGSTYTVGKLAPWVMPSWYLRGNPLGLLAATIVGCILVGAIYLWALRRRAVARRV